MANLKLSRSTESSTNEILLTIAFTIDIINYSIILRALMLKGFSTLNLPLFQCPYNCTCSTAQLQGKTHVVRTRVLHASFS